MLDVCQALFFFPLYSSMEDFRTKTALGESFIAFRAPRRIASWIACRLMPSMVAASFTGTMSFIILVIPESLAPGLTRVK